MNKTNKSPEQEPPFEPQTPASVAAMPNSLPATPKTGTPLPPEYGGRKGPEATRYGDWEMNGKCVDF